MIKALTDVGYDYVAMDAGLTRFGGIETRDEGIPRRDRKNGFRAQKR